MQAEARKALFEPLTDNNPVILQILGFSRREMFYVEEFDCLQREHENIRWSFTMSDPKPEDDWTGNRGFIHHSPYEHYLKDHPAPGACECYLCGPPMMNAAVTYMLDELGVEPENILLDDFGVGGR